MSKKEPIEITISPGARWVLIIYAIINLIVLGGIHWSVSLKQQSATAQPITTPAVKQQAKPAPLPKAATEDKEEELDDGLDELEDPLYKSPPQDAEPRIT